MASAREEAQRLIEEGLTVVPAHPIRKHPLVPWAQWQTEDPPDSLVERWLGREFEGANYAIVCGKQLVVIDADSQEAEVWIKENLPFTPRTVKTSRGRHFYFQASPDLEIRNSTNVNAKIDVRGKGGIVIAPGSVHESGAVYTEEVVEGFDGDWRELPPVRQADVSRIEDFNKGSVLLDPSKLGVEEGGVGVSGRNDAAARKAGLLINNGYSLTETIEELLEWNKFNRPPLEREEVIRTARSIMQTHERNEGVREKEKEKQLVEIKEELSHRLEPKPFAIKDFAAIPKREWVYGRHYIRKFLSVTVAGGGTGKTALTMAEAVAMATGRNLLGVETEKRRVWVWNLEDPLEELHRRLAAIMLHYGIDPEEYEESLFVNSGRDDRLMVTQKIGDQIVPTPVVDLLVEFITRCQIDVVIIDPFVATHDINENDNMAMNAVVTQWAVVADRANCAIEIVHHTRKAQAMRSNVSYDDARGASALTDKARHVRRLVKMTPDEARLAGIDESLAWRYTREADSKDNLAPPTTDNSWREMRSIDLPNGDNVGVVEAWSWPDAFSDITVQDLEAVKGRMKEGNWRLDVRSKHWFGNAVAEALELDVLEASVKSKIKQLMEVWLENGQFEIFEMVDAKARRSFSYVRPIWPSEELVPF